MYITITCTYFIRHASPFILHLLRKERLSINLFVRLKTSTNLKYYDILYFTILIHLLLLTGLLLFFFFYNIYFQ